MSFSLSDSEALSSPSRPTVEWEEVACPLCSHDIWKLLIEAPDRTPGGSGLWFPVVRCQECGLCYTNPRPTQQSIRQFYTASYGPHCSSPASEAEGVDRRTCWPGRTPTSWPRRGEGRLLDFGCGNGRFLARMQARGWQVLGLDVSETTIEQVRSRLGLRVLVGSLPHPDLTPGSFDLITMWHSLEHVHQPLEVLRAATNLLAPGGRLIVAVPNIDSLPFRWFGYAWWGLDLPRHLVHFAPRTLGALLGRAGLRLESLRMLRHSSWLRHSAEVACREPRPSLMQRLIRSRLLARALTWYSYLTDQADCIMATAVRGPE